ncbi:MAG: CDP-alcohol phosphatidyltransferase family protein [Balneolaceae bacterium]|nr:MAG: CDP-alcohol phosphatidyltransferase family protein [Balneolaceae bacterium]
MAPVFLFLFIQEDLLLRGISLVVFAIAAITDAFDGYFARKYDAESEFGVFMDPLADKFLTFAGFVCLPFLDPHQFPWWAILLIVVRDAGVTMLRVFSKRKGFNLETLRSAKIKTAVQMGYLYVALLFGFLLLFGGPFGELVDSIYQTNLFYWALMLVTAITVYTGFEYILVNRALFSKK